MHGLLGWAQSEDKRRPLTEICRTILSAAALWSRNLLGALGAERISLVSPEQSAVLFFGRPRDLWGRPSFGLFRGRDSANSWVKLRPKLNRAIRDGATGRDGCCTNVVLLTLIRNKHHSNCAQNARDWMQIFARLILPSTDCQFGDCTECAQSLY